MTLILCRLNEYTEKRELFENEENPLEFRHKGIIFAGDSISTRRDNENKYVPVFTKGQKIFSVPLSYEIPRYSVGRLNGYSTYKCHDIGIAFAGSQTVALSTLHYLHDAIKSLYAIRLKSVQNRVVLSSKDTNFSGNPMFGEESLTEGKVKFELKYIAKILSKILAELSFDFGSNNSGGSPLPIEQASCSIAIGGFCEHSQSIRLFHLKPSYSTSGAGIEVGIEEIQANTNLVLGVNLLGEVNMLTVGEHSHSCIAKKFTSFLSDKIKDTNFPTIGGDIIIGFTTEFSDDFVTKKETES